MKIERKVIFTEEEEKAVAKVIEMLEELIEGYDIYNIHNPVDDIALDELLGTMNSFQGFVNCPCEWKIDN